MKIAVIDFRSTTAAVELSDSLSNTGFAVIKNHPIPVECLHSLYSSWRDFFSSDDKHEFRVDPNNMLDSQAGFYPAELSETAVGADVKDIKEFFHVRPQQRLPAHVADVTESYREQAQALGRTLLAWIDETNPGHFGDIKLESLICPEASLLRVLHYPPLADLSTGGMRAAPHEDINLITLLPAAQEPGLEVQDNSGCWHRVPTATDQIIINSGDMLAELSNGKFPSTSHRVVNPTSTEGNISRISAPYFLTPRLETRLSPRYTAGEYLQERLRSLSR